MGDPPAPRPTVRPLDLGFGRLFNAIGDAIIVRDLDSESIVLWNKAAVKMFGYTVAEAVGMPVAALLPENVRQEYAGGFGRLGEMEESAGAKSLLARRKNGEVFPAEATHSLVEGRDGRRYLSSFVRDVGEQVAAQEERGRISATMRQLLDSTDEGIYGIDLEHRCTFVNRGALEMIGHDEEEVMGKNVHELVHYAWEDCSPYPVEECPIFRAARTGTQCRVDTEVFWRADGTMFPVEYSARPITVDGRITGAVIAFQDITERRRAQQELDRIFELSPDLLAVANFDGYFLRLNPEWSRVLGWDIDELQKTPFLEFVHPDDVEPTLAEMAGLTDGGETLSFENRYRCKDGSYKWMLWNAISIPAERLIYAAARDITDRKRQEEEVARSNAELEQFSYVASHDLQEPLRMVASYVQLLANRYVGKLDADADEFIGYAVDGATRMQALIHDLLAYSRVGKERRFEEVDMNEIIERVKGNLLASIIDTDASIEASPLPTLSGDPSELTQLFQNLIANALKFHGDERPVIRVTAESSEAGWLFSVRDNGIGIDPEYADRIFSMFQRLHSRGEYPGTGIGLAICQKIIERYGGRIWVESEQGKGAAFFFTLPARSDDASNG